MEQKALSLAVIGYGGMGSSHAMLITEKLDYITLAGIYDIDNKRITMAKENNLFTYNNLEEVLLDDKVDIVLIATPNDSHKDIAIKALMAGKHVICEKPVTLDSFELQEIIDTANACNKVFTVHQNRRWDQDFCTIKKIYDENILNGVYHIESRVHGSRGIPGDWRGNKEQGGGMVLDWGVHILDQMLMMVQEKITKVYCSLDHITNHEVDDGFAIRLTFESGKTALLEVGTHHFINLPRWYMVGRDGTAVIEDFSCEGKIVKVKSWEDKDVMPIKTGAGMTKTMAPRTAATTETLELPIAEPDVLDFYRNVADVIDGKAQLIVKHEEVMRVMKLMEAAFLSDTLGEVVDVIL